MQRQTMCTTYECWDANIYRNIYLGAIRLQGSGAAVRTQRSSSPIPDSFLPPMKLSAEGRRNQGAQHFRGCTDPLLLTGCSGHDMLSIRTIALSRCSLPHRNC